MKYALIALAICLLAWPAWGLSCDDANQRGEYLLLELVEVRVDGEVLDDLSAYENYQLSLATRVDEYETDGVIQSVTFYADRSESGEDYHERHQSDSIHERYGPDVP